MKLKLWMAVAIVLISLSSCTTEATELHQASAVTDTCIDFRDAVKKQYDELTFYPHKGKYIGATQGITAEFLAHENKIKIVSNHYLLTIMLHLIEIVEQPDHGQATSAQGCNGIYYIDVDSDFAHCLDGTQNSIFIPYYYH